MADDLIDWVKHAILCEEWAATTKVTRSQELEDARQDRKKVYVVLGNSSGSLLTLSFAQYSRKIDRSRMGRRNRKTPTSG